MNEHTNTPLDRTPMWTLDELCAKVHTTPATVHTWRTRGTAPRAYRIGRHLYFEDSEVRTWLAKHDADAAETGGDSDSGW
ncbi:MAG: helix-turn-helix transcriptional regulator [Georgenia sp.]